MTRVQPRHDRRLLIVALTWLVLPAGSFAANTVDFDRDVQPILAEHCLKCHGNGTAEAGLQFTGFDAATTALPSGERAVVPGNPEASALLARVSANDEFLRMPPDGDPLPAEDVETLRTWIASGAHWPAHWAYRPLTQPAVPDPEADSELRERFDSPIDRFVLARLVENGLSPAPPADRRTLLRRVCYDLIGLPPTPEEMEAFLNDSAPGAFERVVDRLLDSPRYGERWARHWMDVVHYAESHGHDQDRPREHAWPYRDYLIQSFNDDTPWARFVQEQVAGDALFPEDPQAIAATGFLATGPWDESSLRDIREDAPDRIVARYIDRDDIVTTVMSTFISTTVHCARCHDHKFDPVSQDEYYALQAVFAGTDKANRPWDPDPQVASRRRQLQQEQATLSERREHEPAQLIALHDDPGLIAWERSQQEILARWKPVRADSAVSGGGATLRVLDDLSVLADGTRPDKDVTTLTVTPAVARVTGLRIEVLPHESLPMSGPGRCDNGNLHLNELRVFAIPDGSPERPVELTLVSPVADFNQSGWTIEHAIDGNPNTAWGIFPEVGRPHEAIVRFASAVDMSEHRMLRVELHQLHGGSHLIGRLRLSVTDRDAVPGPAEARVPSDVAQLLPVPRTKRTTAQQLALVTAYEEQRLQAELAALPPQQLVYCGTSQFEPDGSFRPAAEPRTVHVLGRGDVNQPLREAQPGTLSCLPGLSGALEPGHPSRDASRRAALAGWLTDRSNVLTWRSAVNRVWHYHFGQGIVTTPGDFGRMGGTPSHPELLDWLAAEFRDSGGSLKALHRRIVTSATWQQSTAYSPDAAAVDSGNRLLWQMNRRRLDAESIRDSVLQIAGTLDLTMGGPSVRQFDQSPGVHVTPNVDYLNFDVDAPENHRRSVYRFVFRTLPDPFMDALDCPDASQLTHQRTSSLTALHALALLHDRTLVRQCEILAEDLQSRYPDPEAQVREAWRRIFCREPTDQEVSRVARYAQQHGLSNACRFLLNTNEFLFVD